MRDPKLLALNDLARGSGQGTNHLPSRPQKKLEGDISINFNLDYQGPDYEYLKYRIMGTRPGRRRVNLRKNVLKKKKEKGNYIKQL